MKRKFRILSLLMMTVIALTFFTMTANGSEDNIPLDDMTDGNTPMLISDGGESLNDEGTVGTEVPTLISDGESLGTSADQISGQENRIATVTADKLNMRCGTSTQYPVIKILSKGQKLNVIAVSGDWYIVQEQTEGYIGCVSVNYVTFELEQDNGEENSNDSTNGISQDVQTLLSMVNSVRKSNGLKELKYNAELSRVATHKAMDMVENNYFAHESKIYGTPFQMIKSYGIKFSAAAENIAGNQSVERAFEAWMNSSGHAANILNSKYTETGIGIYKSPVYGLVLVQMFITP